MVTFLNGLPVYFRGRQTQHITFDITRAVRIRPEDIDAALEHHRKEGVDWKKQVAPEVH
jgi:hypothetical protein